MTRIISIHVPREGDDLVLDGWKPTLELFQSTSPVRGTTSRRAFLPVASVFQSTSPVRGTTELAKQPLNAGGISIHVPREGDDYHL